MEARAREWGDAASGDGCEEHETKSTLENGGGSERGVFEMEVSVFGAGCGCTAHKPCQQRVGALACVDVRDANEMEARG